MAGEVERLLALRRGRPFVVARGWHQAARLFERRPDHRLLRDGLGPCVERPSLNSLSGLLHHAGIRPHRMGTSS